jgi:ABC-2 type transport system permease protein
MKDPIRAELRKLRTVRSGWAVLAGIAVFTGLAAIAVVTTAGHQGNPPLASGDFVDVLRVPLSILTGAVAILGILAMAGEYRHGTIVSTYLTSPRRTSVVMAKAIALALTGALVGLAACGLAAAVAAPFFVGKHVDIPVTGELALVAAGVAVATGLYGALGVAVGALVRNQTAAITAILVWMLAVEGLIPNIVRNQRLGRWLPWGTVKGITRWDDAVPMAAGLAVLVAYVAALTLSGVVLVRRQDVT